MIKRLFSFLFYSCFLSTVLCEWNGFFSNKFLSGFLQAALRWWLLSLWHHYSLDSTDFSMWIWVRMLGSHRMWHHLCWESLFLWKANGRCLRLGHIRSVIRGCSLEQDDFFSDTSKKKKKKNHQKGESWISCWGKIKILYQSSFVLHLQF